MKNFNNCITCQGAVGSFIVELSGQLLISFADFENGMYFVQILTGGVVTHTDKAVIMK